MTDDIAIDTTEPTTPATPEPIDDDAPLSDPPPIEQAEQLQAIEQVTFEIAPPAAPTTFAPEGKTWHPTKGYVPIGEVDAQSHLDGLADAARHNPTIGLVPRPAPNGFVPRWLEPIASNVPDLEAQAESIARTREEQARVEAATGKPIDALQAHADRYRASGLPLPAELALKVPPAPPAPVASNAALEARVRDLEARLAVGTAVVTAPAAAVPTVEAP